MCPITSCQPADAATEAVCGKTTFIKQLNHSRELLSRNYLKERSISNDEIVFLIGYSDANVFSRAFRNWKGMTTAINVFVRQAVNYGGIPFEIVKKDKFYNARNTRILKQSIQQLENGAGMVHELIGNEYE